MPLKRAHFLQPGDVIAAEEFEQRFNEYQVPHSTAFFSRLDGQPYLVGPLARMNLNATQLPASVQTLMAETGLAFPNTNMFMSLAARAVEILYALGEAAACCKIITPSGPHVDVSPRAGVAMGAPKRRAGCSGTAMKSMRKGAFCPRASSRPPARTRRASRKTCGCR